jgi:hypothetical protein
MRAKGDEIRAWCISILKDEVILGGQSLFAMRVVISQE